MIIDAHVHVKGGDQYLRYFNAEEIVRCMDEAGIDKSVVFAISVTSAEANAMTLREVAKFPDRLIGFAYALPAFDRLVIDDLERAITSDGMRGIKMHSGVARLHDYLAGPVLELAGRLGVPVLADVAGDMGIAKDLVENHKGTNIIFAHLGGLGLSETGIDWFIELARTHDHVYLDTSYVPKAWKIADAIAKAGAEKVIWGSDGPLIHPRLELEKVKILGLPADAEAKVLGGNIARLIGA